MLHFDVPLECVWVESQEQQQTKKYKVIVQDQLAAKLANNYNEKSVVGTK